MPSPALASLALDRGTQEPLHRQITQRIRAAILDGSLAAGTRLPSTRSLASQLAASRGTVELAYALLAAEGYIAARGPAGTVVDPKLAATRARPAPAPPREHQRGDVDEAMPAMPRPFRLGLPALDAFPRKLWSRLVARRARGLSTITMVYQDPAGYLPLRQAIVHYLALARGVACTVDQVFVTAGFHGALGLVAQALLEPGVRAWVEDPGFYRAPALLSCRCRSTPTGSTSPPVSARRRVRALLW
jgi:GntR family transcriptional regulator/MocR family aminotransferase